MLPPITTGLEDLTSGIELAHSIWSERVTAPKLSCSIYEAERVFVQYADDYATGEPDTWTEVLVTRLILLGDHQAAAIFNALREGQRYGVPAGRLLRIAFGLRL